MTQLILEVPFIYSSKSSSRDIMVIHYYIATRTRKFIWARTKKECMGFLLLLGLVGFFVDMVTVIGDGIKSI